MLPLAVPGLVLAYGFIALLLQFNLRTVLQTGPFWILVIAYSVRRLPYLVRSAAGGLRQTSVTLEEAAANLGTSPLRVLWRITLPLILANLIAGSLLTFSYAMLEVSDSLLLAQSLKFYPITHMIYVLGDDMSGPANVRMRAWRRGGGDGAAGGDTAGGGAVEGDEAGGDFSGIIFDVIGTMASAMRTAS